jgi:uncharacterized glyoxalase superfamily protein PhnB
MPRLGDDLIVAKLGIRATLDPPLPIFPRPPNRSTCILTDMTTQTKSTLIPSLRYRDALAAIDWLVQAFGFEKNAVYTTPEDEVAHAQLTYGGGMIMIGSVPRNSDYIRTHPSFFVQPDEIDLRETRGIYIVVPDADAVYERAKAAGAKIETEIRDMEYGGRAFTCRDPESHLWDIGTYDPWVHTS